MANHITATYSPDDNKIRIYPLHRLDSETYDRVRAAGYIWAPKQDCFTAPCWTPERADLAAELATSGEIEDDDRSLLERAEDRAERFDDYSASRTQDGQHARAAASAIVDHIPLGQPILVGHHSQRRAERDAARIENGMRKAAKAFDTAEYWARRAAGAIAAAKYKERPDVRARRIKTIEADKRKSERNVAEHAQDVKLAALAVKLATDAPEKVRRALDMACGGASYSQCYPLADFPRDPPATQYEGRMSIYSAVTGGVISFAQAAEIVSRHAIRAQASNARWIEHYEFRLAYERAMLAEQTGQTVEQVMAPAPRRQSAAAALPLLNYSPADGVILVRNPYRRGETMAYPVEAMTKADYAKISADYKGTRISADGTHRVRTAMRAGCCLVAVFLIDSKAHPIPAAPATAAA